MSGSALEGASDPSRSRVEPVGAEGNVTDARNGKGSGPILQTADVGDVGEVSVGGGVDDAGDVAGREAAFPGAAAAQPATDASMTSSNPPTGEEALSQPVDAASGELSSKHSELSRPAVDRRRSAKTRGVVPYAVDLSKVQTRIVLLQQAFALQKRRRQFAADETTLREIEQQEKTLTADLGKLNEPVAVILGQPLTEDEEYLELVRKSLEAAHSAVGLVQLLHHAEKTKQKGSRSHFLTLLAQAASTLEQAFELAGMGEDLVVAEIRTYISTESKRFCLVTLRYMDEDDHADVDGIDELLKEISKEWGGIKPTVPVTQVEKTTVSKLRSTIAKILDTKHATGAKPQSGRETSIERVVASREAAHGKVRQPLREAVRPLEQELLGDFTPENQKMLNDLLDATNNVPLQQVESSESRASSESSELGEEDNVLDEEADQPFNDDVYRVRKGLRGRKLLLVGGTPRPEPRKLLREAFELAEVHWIEITEHTSAQPLKPFVEHPDTAVVVVLVKFSGHVMIDNVREWARACNKLVVYVTGGYHPNRVAHAICAQASRRLGLDDPATDSRGEGI